MKLVKIRLPDDNMAIYDVKGIKRLKSGDDVITKTALVATKINGEWRRSGRCSETHASVTVDSALFDEMPVAIDMAPGMIYQYEPTVQEDGETIALQRKAKPVG